MKNKRRARQNRRDEYLARKIHFDQLEVPAYRHVAKWGRIGDLEPCAYVEYNTNQGTQTDTESDENSTDSEPELEGDDSGTGFNFLLMNKKLSSKEQEHSETDS